MKLEMFECKDCCQCFLFQRFIIMFAAVKVLLTYCIRRNFSSSLFWIKTVPIKKPYELIMNTICSSKFGNAKIFAIKSDVFNDLNDYYTSCVQGIIFFVDVRAWSGPANLANQ